MTRARTVAYWTVPSLICLAVHWQGFEAWFRADDFAWLQPRQPIHSFHDLLGALFRPQAQGTIRPWSERAFFMIGYALFGLDSLPFRIVIFATQFMGLALAASRWRPAHRQSSRGLLRRNPLDHQQLHHGAARLGLRLQRSDVRLFPVAGVLSADALHRNRRPPLQDRRMGGIPAWLRRAGIERGLSGARGRIHAALRPQSLPVDAPKRGTLPMFAVSIAIRPSTHVAAPPPATGGYAMHFGASLLRTLAVYWTWSIGPVYLETPPHVRRWMMLAAIALVSLGLLVFLVRKLRAGYPARALLHRLVLVTFAPMLPLRDHMTEYYPYIPVIGIAWLGAWGLTEAWRRGGGARNAAVALAALYVCLGAAANRARIQLELRLDQEGARSGGRRRARATNCTRAKRFCSRM